MKKIMLLLSAVVLASVSSMAFESVHKKAHSPIANAEYVKAPASLHQADRTRADENTYSFTYAGTPQTAYKLNGLAAKEYVYMAFQFRTEDLKKFVGSSITGVTLITPTIGGTTNNNLITNIIAFVTDDLSTTPTTRKASRVTSRGGAMATINFDTPLKIEDASKPLYVGYYFRAVATEHYFLWTDLAPSKNQNMMVGKSADTQMPTEWTNLSEEYGSLCVTANIQGENIPMNCASILEAQSTNSYVAPGGKYTYKVNVANKGANAINSLEFETTVGTKTVTKEVTLSKPLEAGAFASGVMDIDPDMTIEETGCFNVTMKVTKVNGEANGFADEGANASVASYKDGYDRKVVLEDATGTWCGWCPAGIVLLEYARKLYPNDMFGIGVHNGDRLAISDYNGFMADYIDGLPSIVINRESIIGPANYDSDKFNALLKQIYEEANKVPAYGKLDLTVDVSGKFAEVKAETEMSVDCDVPHFLSFAVVEDGVGPYDQNNEFSGKNRIMDGWENKGTSVSTIYDDVARSLTSYPGIEGSVPAKVTKGEKLTYTTKIPLTKVTGKNYRVIGMLTNAVTGQIINSAMWTSTSDVEDLAAEGLGNADIRVYGGLGEVIVSGAENVNVYTLDGRSVATTGLNAGIYIVKADGKSFKVVVR